MRRRPFATPSLAWPSPSPGPSSSAPPAPLTPTSTLPSPFPPPAAPVLSPPPPSTCASTSLSLPCVPGVVGPPLGAWGGCCSCPSSGGFPPPRLLPYVGKLGRAAMTLLRRDECLEAKAAAATAASGCQAGGNSGETKPLLLDISD